MQTAIKALDLSKEFPRSPNESLGHYVLLPRIIDKCRAFLAGTNDEYKYNCPLDRQFFDYADVCSDGLKAEVEAGKTDEEILTWVQANAKERSDDEIMTWSYNQRWRRPAEDAIGHFEGMRLEIAPDNYNIETWFQLLDADENRFN